MWSNYQPNHWTSHLTTYDFIYPTLNLNQFSSINLLWYLVLAKTPRAGIQWGNQYYNHFEHIRYHLYTHISHLSSLLSHQLTLRAPRWSSTFSVRKEITYYRFQRPMLLFTNVSRPEQALVIWRCWRWFRWSAVWIIIFILGYCQLFSLSS